MKDKWTSINAGLPDMREGFVGEDGERYSEQVLVTYIDNSSREPEVSGQAAVVNAKGEWFWSTDYGNAERCNTLITAWMPMPKPYNAGT